MAPRRATKTQAPALVKEPVTRTTSVLAADRPAASTDLLCQDEAQTSSGMSQALRWVQTGSKIIVVSGAGISAAAGVPEYHKLRKDHKSSLDISEYQTSESTARFHGLISELQSASASAKPTLFHALLNTLAVEGRLLRHYTQNVDCLEQRLPQLSTRSAQLHGRIDQTRCQLCGWCGPSFALTGSEVPECDECMKRADDRERSGKRRIGVGKLRPNIVLHGEETYDGDIISEIASHDLLAVSDVVVVVGTRLQVAGARKLVMELCRATRHGGGTTVWLSKTGPPVSMKTFFDIVLLGDCEAFALRCVEA